MRTAIISDLHLGNSHGEDLLRDPATRGLLLEEIAAADRLVLLGDTIELREKPIAKALAETRPFFEDVGAAMAGRDVILVPGNHDHRLAETLLEGLALDDSPLGLEHHFAPLARAETQIAEWLQPARLDLTYPGCWLRDDVYATHGHYMDCHMDLPRLECLAAAAVMRAFGPLPPHTEPADYERVLRPVYGLSYSVAQSGLAEKAARPSERAWRALANNGTNSRGRKAISKALKSAAVPATVWSINRALRASFDADLSGPAIAASGIAAAAELSARLGVKTNHFITGHTHRGGPEEADAVWKLPGGGHLHNSGNWVFASAFHHPGTPPGPYWPGTITWLEDEAPPRRVRLLLDRTRDELKATVAELAGGG